MEGLTEAAISDSKISYVKMTPCWWTKYLAQVHFYYGPLAAHEAVKQEEH